jgi:hypothetical protein
MDPSFAPASMAGANVLPLKEGLNKSILDLPAHAESGACPISASTNQALTCLIRGPAI